MLFKSHADTACAQREILPAHQSLSPRLVLAEISGRQHLGNPYNILRSRQVRKHSRMSSQDSNSGTCGLLVHISIHCATKSVNKCADRI